MVEIAYMTFEAYRRQSHAKMLYGMLVQPAQKSDPSIRITARTLPERNFSTRVLEQNGFQLNGTIQDPEDGEVWEWEYISG